MVLTTDPRTSVCGRQILSSNSYTAQAVQTEIWSTLQSQLLKLASETAPVLPAITSPEENDPVTFRLPTSDCIPENSCVKTVISKYDCIKR